MGVPLIQNRVIAGTATAPAPLVGSAAQARAALRRWFLWTTAGEVAGFTVPAVTGVLTVTSPAPAAWSALVLAGAIEGAALGWAQASALRPLLPRIDRRRFTALTSVAAMVAYAVAMTPSVMGERLLQTPAWIVVPACVVAATVLLGSIGFAQWLELRRLLPHPASWIGWTALAWTLGLSSFMAVAVPLWHEDQAAAAAIAVAVTAAFVMAVVVALVTGAALLRLVRRMPAQLVRRDHPEPDHSSPTTT
ncbi:hypothetical protein [Pedococcus sp. 5OH_020]|uniref:hypothetical protein n=1 Tax=Pedococcus sp. 5OH_020 TaxID=2989814 RepID=UPI0022E9AF2F|nr:hypothetical protein [Pedococcus sp. 5OH_020]